MLRAVPTTPTPAASSNLADVYMLLEDGYDKARRDYRVGWSDDRIAKDAGVSVELVTRRREQDYGPIAPPKIDPIPEISAMTEAVCSGLLDVSTRLAALTKRAAEVSSDVTKLQALVAKAKGGADGL